MIPCRFKNNCKNRPKCNFYHDMSNFNICSICEPNNQDNPDCKGDCGGKLNICKKGSKCENIPNCWFFHSKEVNENICSDCCMNNGNQINQPHSVNHYIITFYFFKH